MPTEISCGATDCDFNQGKNSPGATGTENPICSNPMIRVAKGKMGAAVCFNYTNAPLGQRKMLEDQGVVNVPSAGSIEQPLY